MYTNKNKKIFDRFENWLLFYNFEFDRFENWFYFCFTISSLIDSKIDFDFDLQFRDQLDLAAGDARPGVAGRLGGLAVGAWGQGQGRR